MTFDLKVITIETKPRAGYFILDEGEFSTVKKVVPQRSEVYLDNGKVLSIADASKKVANLSVKLLLNKRIKLLQKLIRLFIVISVESFVVCMIRFLMEMMFPKRIENIKHFVMHCSLV